MTKRIASLLSVAVLVLVCPGPGRSGRRDSANRERQTRSERKLQRSYPDPSRTAGAVWRSVLPDTCGSPGDRRAGARDSRTARSSGPTRTVRRPPEGGAKVVGLEHTAGGGNEFGAGNVGGYNLFWIDRGTDTYRVDGKIPTSIILDPPNGRMPAMTPAAMKKMMDAFVSFLRPNDGTAWVGRTGRARPVRRARDAPSERAVPCRLHRRRAHPSESVQQLQEDRPDRHARRHPPGDDP